MLSRGWQLGLLFLFMLLVRLPLIWDPLEVRNDGAEYLGIARRLARGDGYSSNLKYHFFHALPVRHNALGDRPPLAPLAFAAWSRLFPGLPLPAAARLLCVILTAAAAVVCWLLLFRLTDAFTAWAATLYCFLLPNNLYWSAQPMSEAFWLLGVPLALLFWELGRSQERAAAGFPWAAAAGASAGLVYLARPAGLLILAAFVAAAFLGRQGWRAPAAAALGFAAAASPYHLALWFSFGQPFYTTLNYTFSVVTYLEATTYGYESRREGLAELLRTRAPELLQVWSRQWLAHAEGLLLPLVPMLPALAAPPRTPAGLWTAPLVYCAATLLVHLITWSAWGSSRYFLALHPLLVGFLLAPLAARPRLRRLAVGAMVLGLTLALPPFVLKQAKANHGRPELAAVRAVLPRLQGRGLLASNRPSQLNFLTERDSVMLPHGSSRDQLARFLRQYEPVEVVLFLVEPELKTAMRQAGWWRAGAFEPGWRLAWDSPSVLVARKRSGGPRRPAQ